MSTPGPDDPESTPPPAPELDGLDPQDLLAAGLHSEPLMTRPPQPPESDATLPVSRPQPSQPPAAQVELPSPEELTALLPGGNYHVDSFLGQGGMGAVYKGTQVRLKRPVAIKIMRRDFGKDYDFEARFEREAQAMAKLNHPNIVSVIDFGEAGPDYLYIVMELVDGADMMDVIRTGRMTQEMALTLLPQICDALQFAHDHGIVHRDIKPSNIMLTRDGRIKMADFGLAKRFDAESSFRTQTGTGMGTPDYAAPEQFDANAPIDHRADIYALGVMIYQMITGALPRGVWKPPSQRAEIDPHWDDIVSRAMQSDPKDRYQQASDVKSDVSSIPLAESRRSRQTAEEPAPKAPQPRVLANAPTKSRAALAIGTVVICLIAFAAVMFATREKQSSAGVASGASQEPAPAAPAPSASKSTAPQSTPAPKAVGGGRKPGTAPAAATPAPIAAPALPESGWKPLFTETEWKAKPGFKDGQLNLSHAYAAKPQNWSDGAIRTRIQYQDRSKVPSLVARQIPSGIHYRLGIGSTGDHLFLSHSDPKGSDPGLLTRQFLPVALKPGDKVLLELRVQGDRLTGLLDGKVALEAQDSRLQAPGEWGITAIEGWFESVEVQPLPPAAAEPWQDWLGAMRKRKQWSRPTWEDDGNQVRWLKNGSQTFTKTPARDQAVRVTWVVGEGRNNYIALRRSTRPGGSGYSEYRLSVEKTGRVYLGMLDGQSPAVKTIKAWPAPAGFDPAVPQTYEFRAVGDTLSAFVGGQLLGTVTDARFQEGIPVMGGDPGIVLTALEYASLNGVSLNAPSATTSNSEPWVDVLAQVFAKGPGDGSFDALTKVADGAEVKRRESIHFSLSSWRGDIAVRARVRGMKQAATFSLRGAGGVLTGDQRGYHADLRADGSAQIRRRDANDKWVQLADFPAIPGFDKAAMHTVEFRAEGDLLTLLVDDETLGSARDSTFAKGGGYFLGDPGMVIEALEYLDLGKASPSAASSSPNLPVSSSPVATATKDAPFINSLGMKFVPVPGTKVLFSTWHTRVQDYAAFAVVQEAAGKKVDGAWKNQQKDGVPVGLEADHPVVGVSWEDAQAFCAWLTANETAEGKLSQGARYRLPSDAEWSTAVGLTPEGEGAPMVKHSKNLKDYPWGTEWPTAKKVGNYADESFHAKFQPGWDSQAKRDKNGWLQGYDDGFPTTAPVGSFPPNTHGLYDMGGNVWQFCEDLWGNDTNERVLRGSSWINMDLLHSSGRNHYPPNLRNHYYGFRCVLEPAPEAATSGRAMRKR